MSSLLFQNRLHPGNPDYPQWLEQRHRLQSDAPSQLLPTLEAPPEDRLYRHRQPEELLRHALEFGSPQKIPADVNASLLPDSMFSAATQQQAQNWQTPERQRLEKSTPAQIPPAPASTPALAPPSPSSPQAQALAPDPASEPKPATPATAQTSSPQTPAAPQAQSSSPTPATPSSTSPPPTVAPSQPQTKRSDARTAPDGTEYDPKVVEALKQASAQVEADAARQKRETELAELEADGMAEHAKTLRELDAEMATRRADMEKRHPDRGTQYQAGLRELEKEKNARQAQVMDKVQEYKTKDRADTLRAAKMVVSREDKQPKDRSKTEEQKQADWKSQMEKAGLDPSKHAHVRAYWDAKMLQSLNSGMYAKYDWDGSPPKRKGFGSAVLSDGSLHVAPEFIHDDKKYAAAVAASDASTEEKARAMAELPRLQQAYAQALLPVLKQAGSTRAAEWIPGIASFQKWQSEKPRQGTEAEQANEYLKEMNQRGGWSKGTDNVLRSLLAGFADMGTMAAGVAGVAGIQGASEAAADWSKRSSDFMAPVSAEGGNSGAASSILGHVARMAGPMAATLLLTRGLGGGLGTMSALSGAQTAGSQYAETYGKLREEGKTHAEAWKATAPWALASGLVTASLTAAGGRTGFEAALGAKAGTQTAAKQAAQGFWKDLLRNVPKHALADIPQELPDELFSQISSALATNPQADLGQVVGDFIKNAPELMGAIALMGGAGGAMATHQQSKNTSAQAQGETQDQPSPSAVIPYNTTIGDQNATDSGQQSPATDSNNQPSQTTPSAARPSQPSLDVETSKKLIANVEAMAKKRPLNPVEQADLDQAKAVVVADAQKLIDNISKLRPEAQQNPKVQKDLAEAKKLVETHSQKPQPPSTKTGTNDATSSASPTLTQSSSGSLPPGTSATTHGDAPPAATHTGEPAAGSSSDDQPSATTATWSTGGEDHTRSSSDSASSDAPPDLPTAAKALDAAKALRNKGGRITLDEAHTLDQAEKTFASAIKANLEKKQAVTGALTEHETRALGQANATLAGPASRDRGPLPAIPDARRTIQDLSSKTAAGGTLSADEAHQLAHAQRAIAQQRVNDLAAAEASGTLTVPQRRQLDRFREILDTSPYGTELPKGPPPGYDPHPRGAIPGNPNPQHHEWYPPEGEKPVHPANDKFTPEALAIPDSEIKATTDRLKAKGHGHHRHGPEVTEGQLSDRAMYGVDPITQTTEDGEKRGRDHKYSKHATQFTSDRSITQAAKAVESSVEYNDELQKAMQNGDDHFTVKSISLESVFGPNYQDHVRGMTRKGSAANPLGSRPTILKEATILAQYKKDPSTGKFYLNTLFAKPSKNHEPD